VRVVPVMRLRGRPAAVVCISQWALWKVTC